MIVKNWGNYLAVDGKLFSFKSLQKINKFKSHLIARGQGKSYGDSSLQKSILDLREFNRILSFDKEKGVIKVQSGVTIKQILDNCIKYGWFMPVVPGSKYISIGGMVASNVHGKNHITEGSFKNHVKSLKILNKNKKIYTVTCKNKKFNNFFGTMGLLGIILEVTIQLKKIETSLIRQKISVTRNLRETINFFIEHNNEDYIVGWIDISSGSPGRSVIYIGEHVLKNQLKKKKNILKVYKDSKINLSKTFSIFLINNFFINIFNRIFYYKNLIFNNNKSRIVTYNKFFFPLDGIKNWNKIYGKNGFSQFQCIIPLNNNTYNAIMKIFSIISQYNANSFLSVLKLLKKEKGLLSFYEDGITLAIDLPIKFNTKSLFNRLHKIVIESKGKIYLAKDAFLTKNEFQKMYKISKNDKKKFLINRKEIQLCSFQSNRLGITS